MTKQEVLNKLHAMFSVSGCDGSDALALAIRSVSRMPDDHEEFNTVDCKFCGLPVPAKTAHISDGEYVGDDCCWDERLRTTG